MAPSSRAVATFIPLLMADWAWFNWPWVALRYCNATLAELLVLTLKVIGSHLFWLPEFCPGAFWPTEGEASRVPRRFQESLNIDFSRERKIRSRVSAPTRRQLGKFCPCPGNICRPEAANSSIPSVKIPHFAENCRLRRNHTQEPGQKG